MGINLGILFHNLEMDEFINLGINNWHLQTKGSGLNTIFNDRVMEGSFTLTENILWVKLCLV